ncbi:MAG: amidohydrolase [Alistipes sp.]|nr:amidohydrolase [Alistipes sp.]
MTPVEFRRHIHRHPELSFEEYQTAQFIEAALKAEGISCRRIAGTGVLAKIEGRGDVTRAIVLRADIDALPITECTGMDYASENEGVMHACGHDVHAAVLYGALQKLNASRDFEGTIFGIFQPGEECNPGGASKVLAEKPFEGYNVVAVIGNHTDSTLEVGQIGLCAGAFMASNDELRFYVRGKGGHGAMRDKLNDTVAAAANIVTEVNRLNSSELVLSIGKIVAEGATNIIPDLVYMEGTMRTFDASLRKWTWEQIYQITAQVDKTFGTTTEVDINHGYPTVVNSAHLTDLASTLAAEHYQAIELTKRYTAEDFGFYTEQYPSLFYRLGVGTNAGRSHSATFAPDERAIDVGVDFMATLAVKID